MSKSKQIGTAAENHVVDYISTRGFANAERRALFGINDRGDITGTPGVCWQVKGGKMAEKASDAQVAEWMDELDDQISNSGSDVGVLLRKRSGYGAQRVGRWYAHMRMHTVYELLHKASPLASERGCGASMSMANSEVILTFTLEDAVNLLGAAGYN